MMKAMSPRIVSSILLLFVAAAIVAFCSPCKVAVMEWFGGRPAVAFASSETDGWVRFLVVVPEREFKRPSLEVCAGPQVDGGQNCRSIPVHKLDNRSIVAGLYGLESKEVRLLSSGVVVRAYEGADILVEKWIGTPRDISAGGGSSSDTKSLIGVLLGGVLSLAIVYVTALIANRRQRSTELAEAKGAVAKLVRKVRLEYISGWHDPNWSIEALLSGVGAVALIKHFDVVEDLLKVTRQVRAGELSGTQAIDAFDDLCKRTEM